MYLTLPKLVTVIGLTAVIADAHFVLQYPASLGYNDSLEATGPCDSFDPTARTDASTFIVDGEAILVLTTHSDVVWNINAALVSDTSNFISITEDVHQLGVGYFCFGPVAVNVPDSWIGQPAVLQLRQHAPDGILYQCAAVTFEHGSVDAGPSGLCTNTTGTSATWVADSGSDLLSTSSSSSVASSTSTTSSSSESSSTAAASSTITTMSTSGSSTTSSAAISSTGSTSSSVGGSTGTTTSSTGSGSGSGTGKTSSGSSGATGTKSSSSIGASITSSYGPGSTATKGSNSSSTATSATSSSSVTQWTGAGNALHVYGLGSILGGALAVMLVVDL